MPCLLLKSEQSCWVSGHTAWFMDTAGNEYQFSFSSSDHPGVDPNAGDRLLQAQWDGVISGSEFALIVAESKALPRRVTAVEIQHGLALVAASRTGTMETIWLPSDSPDCCGGPEIDSYLFAPQWNGSVARGIERYYCGSLTQRNEAQPARELSQWIGRLLLRARRSDGGHK